MHTSHSPNEPLLLFAEHLNCTTWGSELLHLNGVKLSVSLRQVTLATILKELLCKSRWSAAFCDLELMSHCSQRDT